MEIVGKVAPRLITVSMPPGVEHLGSAWYAASSSRLITVSMPPGVEHLTTIDAIARAAFG